jgi:hypothetical protein
MMSEGLKLKAQVDPSDSEYRGGFLHAWMNGHFQTLDDGRRVFYPQGPLGRRGFEVSSTEKELILRINVRGSQRLLSAVLMVGMFSLIFSMESLESWVFLPIVAGGWLFAWLFAKAYFWRFTQVMRSVDVPNSFIAYAKSMGWTVHPMLLVWQAAFVGAMSGYSFIVAYRDHDLFRMVLGLILVVGLTPHAIALWSWRQTWASTK